VKLTVLANAAAAEGDLLLPIQKLHKPLTESAATRAAGQCGRDGESRVRGSRSDVADVCAVVSTAVVVVVDAGRARAGKTLCARDEWKPHNRIHSRQSCCTATVFAREQEIVAKLPPTVDRMVHRCTMYGSDALACVGKKHSKRARKKSLERLCVPKLYPLGRPWQSWRL